MDIASLLGIFLSLGLIIISIIVSGAPLVIYWDAASALAVFGGAFGAVLIASPLSRVLNIPTYFGIVFNIPKNEKEKIIRQLITFSEDARKEGLLSLDDKLEDVEDDFLKGGMRLVVDGADPEVIKKIMYNELDQVAERHAKGADMMGMLASYAPAFGMIGTVQGLVAMMQNLSDKNAIGKGMALALITTFYGAIAANALFNPTKAKLQDRDKDEMLTKQIIIEGVLSIHNGENPRMLEQKLLTFLPPGERKGLMTEENS